MRYDIMTSSQMLTFVKKMDTDLEKLARARDRLFNEVKALQEHREILTWDEIASAIAYPKAASDREWTSGGFPDEYKLLHQAERINRIYQSQMEDLFTELEIVETQIARIRFVNRCINQLDPKDKEILEAFTRKNLTFVNGQEELHMGRSSLYRAQKHAIEELTELYNTSHQQQKSRHHDACKEKLSIPLERSRED